MQTIDLAKGCKLRRDDGSETYYSAGIQAVPDADAEHWWVKAHMTKRPPPKLGDYAHAQAVRAAADRKKADWEAADAQARAAEEAWEATRRANEAKAAEVQRVEQASKAPAQERGDGGAGVTDAAPPDDGGGSQPRRRAVKPK